MSISPEQLQHLLEIQELEFAAVEINLFLDTHPNQEEAIEEYNEIVHQLRAAKQDYQVCYGPLSNFGEWTSDVPWQWIEDPFPWEINYDC